MPRQTPFSASSGARHERLSELRGPAFEVAAVKLFHVIPVGTPVYVI